MTLSTISPILSFSNSSWVPTGIKRRHVANRKQLHHVNGQLIRSWHRRRQFMDSPWIFLAVFVVSTAQNCLPCKEKISKIWVLIVLARWPWWLKQPRSFASKTKRTLSHLLNTVTIVIGKIIDHMRLKAMEALGVKPPQPPEVREPDKKRFKRIVEFYFPTKEREDQFIASYSSSSSS